MSNSTNLGNTSNTKYPPIQTVGGTVTVVQGTTPWIVAGNQTPGDAVANPSDAVDTRTFLEGFNGTTWDRLRAVGNNADGVTALGLGVLDVNGFTMVWNGTTWDRMREGTATGSVLVNNSIAANLQVTTTPAAGTTVVIAGAQTPGDAVANPTDALDTRTFLEGFNGTTWDRLRAVGNNADAVAALTLGVLDSNAFNMVWNGATWDRVKEGASTGSVLVTVSGPTTATTTLNAQSTIQNGTVLDNGTMRTNHTIAITTSAGVTAGFVQLQVSQDNTNFFTAATVNTNAATTVFAASVTGAWRYVRGAISTAITGGTVTATIASV